MSNIKNSKSRWALHHDGQLHDTKTDKVYPAGEIGIVGDGRHEWDLATVREACSAGTHAEDAIVGWDTTPVTGSGEQTSGGAGETNTGSASPDAVAAALAAGQTSSQEQGDEQTDDGTAQGAS